MLVVLNSEQCILREIPNTYLDSYVALEFAVHAALSGRVDDVKSHISNYRNSLPKVGGPNYLESELHNCEKLCLYAISQNLSSIERERFANHASQTFYDFPIPNLIDFDNG